MIRAVIYARYSEGPHQTDQSIEGQVADCRSYAAAHGMEILEIYADRHISGKSVVGRAEFQRMVHDAERGKFDAVIVWKVDRFGRDRYDIATYKMKLKKAGVSLHYAVESVPDGPEGIILESVLEGLAEYYSADLRQKITRGIRENAKKGVWTFVLPIGYTRNEDRQIVPDPVTAPLVAEAFRLFAAGVKEKDLVEYFREHGVVGQRGGAVSKSVVHRMLRNRRYLGEFEVQGVPLEVEPLVDAELFETVQGMLCTSRNKKNAAGRAKVMYLLSCKCFCAYCGAMLSGESGTSKSGKIYNYYKCGAKKRREKDCQLKPVPQAVLEEAVLRHTMDDMLTDEIIDMLVVKILDIQERDDDQTRVQTLQSQLDGVKKKIRNVVAAIEDGAGTSLVARLNELEEQQEALEMELAHTQIKTPRLTAEAIRTWLCSFRDGDITDETFRRRLVDTFVERIEVKNGEALIIYNATEKEPGSRCSSTAQLVDQTGVEPVSKSLFPVLLLS